MGAEELTELRRHWLRRARMPTPVSTRLESRLREVEQRFKRLQMEHDLLKKNYPVCLRSKERSVQPCVD